MQDMNYVKEKQYCVRLNLSRPEQEKLCRFIENRNRKKYQFLPDYLLAACEALEENGMGSAVHDGLEESMEWIRKELSMIISEIRQHTGK